MTREIPMRSALLAILFAVAVGMTGCAGQQPDYRSEIADRLQGEVLEVSALSADADFAAALQALTELDVDLKDARARGDITEERFVSVTAAAALVRADLEAAIAAQTPPAPTTDGGDGDGDDDEGDDNNGNNGNGNGNGKNKGKDSGND